ncbi:MAG: dinB 2 [Haloplasmataceae bacterium]|jgi:DNA polymerase-4|nr:dinB 2 [Haloplasmataceae bacterium]
MKNNVKIIFHIDMNAFYTSVEQINNPLLRNKPIAIGGKNAIFNKGVIVTASYEARKFGVKAAMPVFEVRELCPHIIILTGNMALYREYSHRFINLLKEYTSLIEIASIDEAYLDVTDVCITKHPLELAKEIQDRLYLEIGLSNSIGIASNKFLAKMASDFKKPMGITVLRRREVSNLLWPLKISDMFGIGKKTAPKLIEGGIKTIGDLVKEENKVIATKVLGNQFEHFYLNALGYGNNIVDPSQNESYKSIGNSLTYNDPVRTEEAAYLKLKELTSLVCTRLINHNYVAKTLSIQIKYPDFKSYSKSKTIENHTDQYDIIYNKVTLLFDELWNRQPIRLLGVSTSNIIEKQAAFEQLDLFSYENKIEDEKIVKLMNNINRKYGDNSIKKAINKKK